MSPEIQKPVKVPQDQPLYPDATGAEAQPSADPEVASGFGQDMRDLFQPLAASTKEKISHAIDYGQLAYNSIRARISRRRADSLEKSATNAEEYLETKTALGKTALSRHIDRADERTTKRARRRADKHAGRASRYEEKAQSAKAKRALREPVSWHAEPEVEAVTPVEIHWRADDEEKPGKGKDDEVTPISWKAEPLISWHAEPGDFEGLPTTESPSTPFKVTVHKKNPTEEERAKGVKDSLFDPKQSGLASFSSKDWRNERRGQGLVYHRRSPVQTTKTEERSNPLREIARRLDSIEEKLDAGAQGGKPEKIRIPQKMLEQYGQYLEESSLRVLYANVGAAITRNLHAERDRQGLKSTLDLERDEYEQIRDETYKAEMAKHFKISDDEIMPEPIQKAIIRGYWAVAEKIKQELEEQQTQKAS